VVLVLEIMILVNPQAVGRCMRSCNKRGTRKAASRLDAADPSLLGGVNPMHGSAAGGDEFHLANSSLVSAAASKSADDDSDLSLISASDLPTSVPDERQWAIVRTQ